ncbi:hypothetical protein [Shewanella putrefaciens]|uniref:TIGR02646 family protein n=1 Tax=Shewanella putrefaciens TaxID=24 RepID=A0ABX8X880_SHEPU|nr:hypothetical protein [Shewanella putrefaciens]MCT8943711.1 TIGR02646 family protein [Shewanella putrefaciens]QSE47998.1 TIGR02646 family protein [Shewanella putrefaciens]QYX71401.1 TIGR02646 family protein [Shewanella putrefaciens]GGN23118.1 hypothetical protein GCM10007984_23670 [Shewanella putrefaciens]
MIVISKLPAPSILTQYKLSNGAEYDGPNFTEVKNNIRDTLLNEQGFICAYCMRRISAGNMKIEHWECQSQFADRQLDYKNMLGCCSGNEGEPQKFQTCDTKKGNQSLKFSPANPNDNIKLLIYYNDYGVISSSDADFDVQLNNVLNLNESRLKRNRAAALSGLKKQLDSKPHKRTKSEIQRILDSYRQLDEDGKFKEYIGVFVYYLEKKLRRL